MRIAIVGTRGIPANYGGFETFAEKLSLRLASHGHEVTVYGRSRYIATRKKFYHNVRLVILPTIMHKYLDTPFHTLLATLHAMFSKHHILLYCNSANGILTCLPRITGKKVAINVDGLEWKRAKWGKFGRSVYRFSEFLVTFLPNCVITDAKEVQTYYWKKFRKKTVWIPYGAPEEKAETKKILKKHGLVREKYILYVSRLEPENNAYAVIKAFEKIKTQKKLVIVGDSPYSLEYVRKLKETKDPRIIFTGYIFGSGYAELQSNAYMYIQATVAGGTQPALVDAMGYGNCVMANDVPQHREVLDNSGIYFSVNDIDGFSEQMQYLVNHPKEVDSYKKKALKRVRENYSWDKVTSDYEMLFKRMLGEL